jgi:integrase
MLAKKIAAPHAARNFLKALRGMMTTAIPAGLRDDDPTLGIRNIKVHATGGFRTWTEGEIAQFEVAHPVDSRAQLAFGLLLYTAQRRGDVVRMGRQDIHDGFIRVRQQKTGAILEIPVLPELQEILAVHPVNQHDTCDDHQIAAFSGHASLKEVQRYTKAADQKRLAVAAMEARAKNKGRTKTGKPKGKVSQNEG